jgi:hypothetical protein
MAITVKHSKVSTIPDDSNTDLVRPSDWNADHTLVGTIDVANGGTGATTLTGYVKGNGTSAMTAVATVPSTDITGLGTMSTQNANAVAITGGTINGTTIGATTPSTGKFSTLEATGTSTLGTASAQFIQVEGGATAVLLSAQGAGTNIPLALQPKGTGALQAQATTSTTAGGNARGANAVDWQTKRNAASQVASGLGSVICGGEERNTASGQQSFVGTGFNNNSSSYGAAIVAGVNGSNAGNSAFIGAGNAQTIGSNGAYSAIVGGNTNTANGRYNFIGGGTLNSGTSGTTVTSQATTAVTSGSTAVTLSGSNANIKVGQLINGTGISENTYVAAISGTSLTLSQNATATGTPTLVFLTPHGVVVGGGNNQATGSYSFIGGGGDAGTAANRNVASGDWSVVAGGVKNLASNVSSFVGGGGTDGSNFGGNTASGQYSGVVVGYGNQATGTGSFVGGGYSNLANAQFSCVLGGARGTTRSIQGNQIFSAHNNPIADSLGINQTGLLVLAVQTTDATATALRSNTAAAGTTNQVILPNNSAYFFRGEVVSGVTGGGDTKGWTIEGVIKRGANAAATTLVGVTVLSTHGDAGAATWAIAVTADTTNGGIRVTFTGQLATTIRTVCQIRTTEMTF